VPKDEVNRPSDPINPPSAVTIPKDLLKPPHPPTVTSVELSFRDGEISFRDRFPTDILKTLLE
jgi:hypothetical protein